jgi:mRNA interferase MazF
VEALVRGDIVVISFPFSDLSRTKTRPAMVLALPPGQDVILVQITSLFRPDSLSIDISKDDFSEGSLPIDSFVRCGKIFTADRAIVLRKAGRLKQEKFTQIINRIRGLFEN